MKSFYAELIENMGVKIERKTDSYTIENNSTPLIPARDESPVVVHNMMEAFTFEKNEDGDNELKVADVIPEVAAREACLHDMTDKKATVRMTGSNDGHSVAATPLYDTTFSGYETRFYDGFTLANNIMSLDYALADEHLTEAAANHFLDGYLAKEYPLAVRINRVEFASTRAQKEYPFIVMTAKNDYGTRACRVFFNLRRIATAGGYSADSLITSQNSLYCGQVGPKDGQLHEWPTPERCGFVAGGKVDAKRIGLVCKKIAEAMPSLQDYMNDLYADAVSAEVVGHKLTHEQLDVLTALWAEVYA